MWLVTRLYMAKAIIVDGNSGYPAQLPEMNSVENIGEYYLQFECRL